MPVFDKNASFFVGEKPHIFASGNITAFVHPHFIPSIMTRIYVLRSLLLALALWGFSTCKKDKTTTVRGKVVDKVTGAALDSVKLDIAEYQEYPLYYQEYGVYSDVNGNFEYSSSDLSVAIAAARRKGYMSKSFGFPEIKKGGVNNVVVELIPADGILKLLLNNTSDKDTIYVGVYSPTLAMEYPSSLGYAVRRPIPVQSMNSGIFIPTAIFVEETVSIYWSLTPWTTYSSISQSPHNGSVFVVKGDTTSFQINI